MQQQQAQYPPAIDSKTHSSETGWSLRFHFGYECSLFGYMLQGRPSKPFWLLACARRSPR